MDIRHETPYGTFEWDSEKDAINRKKHGLGFELACEVFADEFALCREDCLHGADEQRCQLIGQTLDGKVLLLVVYVERERPRIISARLAEKKERRIYVKPR